MSCEYSMQIYRNNNWLICWKNNFEQLKAKIHFANCGFRCEISDLKMNCRVLELGQVDRLECERLVDKVQAGGGIVLTSFAKLFKVFPLFLLLELNFCLFNKKQNKKN